MRHLPLLLLALFAGLATSFPLADTDLWWHLSAGREMLARGTWLRTDPFCLSSLGTPWIDLHWGFQLLVSAVHGLAGLDGLVYLRVLLVLGTVVLSLRARPSWETALVACLWIQSTRPSLDLRPLLVTLPCLAIQWILLERRAGWRSTVGLFLAQVVLANTQGLFLLGPLLALAQAAGSLLERDRARARSELLLALGLVLVSMANPWGWRAFGLAGLVAGRIAPLAGNPFSREIAENLPLWSWIAEDWTRAVVPGWALLGTMALARRGPGSSARIFLLVGTGLLAAMAVRNLPLFALACLLSIAPAPWRRPGIAATVALVVGMVLSIPALAERRWSLPGARVAPGSLPDSTTLSLLADRPGPVFHELRAGGWLTWNLPGRGACWADTRLVLHDGPFLLSLLDLVDRPESFPSWSGSRGIRHVLLPADAWPRDRGLVLFLLRSPEWKLADADGAWVLFARHDDPVRSFDLAVPADREALSRRIEGRFGANPDLLRHVRRSWNLLLSDAGVPR